MNNNQLTTYYPRFVDEYWFFPSLGHWRGIEAAALSEVVGDALMPPILDIGCGDGSFIKTWHDALLIPDVGVDLTFKYVHRASKINAYQHHVLADITETPFTSDYFQTVFSNSTLEHILDLDFVLDEVYRILIAEGRLIFTVPNHNLSRYLTSANPLNTIGLNGLAQRWASRRNRLLGHRHLYPAGKWRELLEEKGFLIEAVDSYLSAPSVALWAALRSADLGISEYRIHVALKYLGYRLDSMEFNALRKVTVWLMQWLCLPYVQRWESSCGTGGACWLIVARKPR